MDKQFAIEVIGTIAMILGFCTQIPQVYKVIKTKDSKGLAVSSYMIAMCVGVLYILIGYLTGIMSLVIGNSIRVFQFCIIIYLVYKHKS